MVLASSRVEASQEVKSDVPPNWDLERDGVVTVPTGTMSGERSPRVFAKGEHR